MAPLSVGVVGAGEIAAVGHLPAYEADSSTTLTAVADLDRERAKAMAREFDVPAVYDSGEKLLREEEIDVLSICTPPNTHKNLFVAAANRGIDVFCEKPFATSLAAAETMHEAASRSGISTAVGYSNRHLANYRKVMAYVRNGVLGEPYNATVTCVVPPPETVWRYDPAVAGGGIVADMAPHWLDFYSELFDAEADVMMSRLDTVDTESVEDYAHFQLGFGEFTVDMTFRWAASGPTSSSVRQNQLVAENATVTFDRTTLDGNINGSGVRFKRGVSPLVSLGPLLNLWSRTDENVHRKAVSAFIDHLVRDGDAVATSRQALAVTRLKQEIYDSSER